MRVHESQTYRKMDVTRDLISRILELREILLSFQTGMSALQLLNVSDALRNSGVSGETLRFTSIQEDGCDKGTHQSHLGT